MTTKTKPAPVVEMALLRELHQLNEEAKAKKKKKSAAASTYHRDYMKTRNKDYRQYDAEEYEREKD